MQKHMFPHLFGWKSWQTKLFFSFQNCKYFKTAWFRANKVSVIIKYFLLWPSNSILVWNVAPQNEQFRMAAIFSALSFCQCWKCSPFDKWWLLMCFVKNWRLLNPFLHKHSYSTLTSDCSLGFLVCILFWSSCSCVLSLWVPRYALLLKDRPQTLHDQNISSETALINELGVSQWHLKNFTKYYNQLWNICPFLIRRVRPQTLAAHWPSLSSLILFSSLSVHPKQNPLHQDLSGDGGQEVASSLTSCFHRFMLREGSQN